MKEPTDEERKEMTRLLWNGLPAELKAKYTSPPSGLVTAPRELTPRPAPASVISLGGQADSAIERLKKPIENRGELQEMTPAEWDALADEQKANGETPDEPVTAPFEPPEPEDETLPF